MGTSLSGLTPATTFDGLLKVGDNDPLTADLKAISTGDGTDTILQLSNSALKITGTGNTTNDIPFSIVNGDGVELLRVSSNGTSSSFTVPSARISNVNFVSGNVIAGNNTNLRIVPQQGGVSINKDYSNADTSTMLHIKGSGTTSATTSLLVQNSAGGNIIKANDDGRVLLGVGTDYQNHLLELNGEGLGDSQTLLRLQSSVNFMGAYTGIGFTNSTNGSSLSSEIRAYRESYGNAMTFNFAGTEMLRATSEGNLGIGETTPTARLQVKGSGNDNTTNAFLVQNSDGTEAFKIQDNRTSVFSGVASFGSVIYSSSDFRGSANLTAGSSTIPANTRAYIKGSGTTSATTALLVQNSAGTEAFKIQDDRNAVFSGATQFTSNVKFLGVNDTNSLNNLRFVVPGSGKSLTINKNYGTTNDASAIVDIQSTTQGFLPPRMTTTERDAIASPAAGLMVYNTTTNKAQCYNGSTWNDLF